MNDIHLLLIVAVAGLSVGFAAFYLSQQKGYCQQVEEEIRANQSFNGTIACYPPGKVDVNVSDAIENRTELRCVCEKSYMGRTQIFTINVAR
ncbi:MAG: hypothetical protein ABEJ07_00775 [Candidatus Nanohaloarchaea archaeon]